MKTRLNQSFRRAETRGELLSSNLCHILKRTLFPILGMVVLWYQTPKLEGRTITESGTMTSEFTFVDHYLVNLPHGLTSLTLTIPLPASEATSCYSESPTDIEVTPSIAPLSSSRQTDDQQNSYQVLTYTNPPAGTIDIKIQVTGQISSTLQSALPRAKLPLTNVPSDVQQYLGETTNVQTSDPAIQAEAHQIAQSLTDEGDLARRISLWMDSTIGYPDPSAYDTTKTDASATLLTRCSTCDGWAHLYCALARVNGIPARFVSGYDLGGTFKYPSKSSVGGLVTQSTASQPHSWIELWFPNVGWVPFDPQGSIGFVDTHHFKFWHGIDGDASLPIIKSSGQNEDGQIDIEESLGDMQATDTVNLKDSVINPEPVNKLLIGLAASN